MYNHVHAYKNKTIYVESRQFQIDSCLYYYNYNVYTTFFNTYLCLKMIRFMFLPTISPIFSVFPKVNSLPESRAGRCKRSWMSGKMSGFNEGQMGMGYTYIYIYIRSIYSIYWGYSVWKWTTPPCLADVIKVNLENEWTLWFWPMDGMGYSKNLFSDEAIYPLGNPNLKPEVSSIFPTCPKDHMQHPGVNSKTWQVRQVHLISFLMRHPVHPWINQPISTPRLFNWRVIRLSRVDTSWSKNLPGTSFPFYCCLMSFTGTSLKWGLPKISKMGLPQVTIAFNTKMV